LTELGKGSRHGSFVGGKKDNEQGIPGKIMIVVAFVFLKEKSISLSEAVKGE
jgi:hypothetical protein